jgi:stage V sporulation protein AA
MANIYIKPNKKYLTSNLGYVRISDIAEVYTESSLQKRVENIKLTKLTSTDNRCYLISVTDIVKAIDNALPGHTITNLGEIDTVVEFNRHKQSNPLWQYIKTGFVSLVLLTGSTTAIMSFHSDAQLPLVFENYYYIFFNERIENPMIIDLPYSIGLAVGIIVFFNHFSGKKLTNDPTPIEVEMTLYEDEVTDNIIDNLSKGSGGNDSG